MSNMEATQTTWYSLAVHEGCAGNNKWSCRGCALEGLGPAAYQICITDHGAGGVNISNLCFSTTIPSCKGDTSRSTSLLLLICTLTAPLRSHDLLLHRLHRNCRVYLAKELSHSLQIGSRGQSPLLALFFSGIFHLVRDPTCIDGTTGLYCSHLDRSRDLSVRPAAQNNALDSRCLLTILPRELLAGPET